MWNMDLRSLEIILVWLIINTLVASLEISSNQFISFVLFMWFSSSFTWSWFQVRSWPLTSSGWICSSSIRVSMYLPNSLHTLQNLDALYYKAWAFLIHWLKDRVLYSFSLGVILGVWDSASLCTSWNVVMLSIIAFKVSLFSWYSFTHYSSIWSLTNRTRKSATFE